MASSASSIATYPHIEIDLQGVPLLAGTTMKVIELVTAQRAHGWSPEELHFQHPYLALGHIHSALAYYWDHKEELDAEIDRRSRLANEIEREAPPSPLRAKLGSWIEPD